MKKKNCIITLLLFCMLMFTMAGCTNTIDYKSGTYTATNIAVYDEITIDYFELELYAQKTAGDEELAIKLSYNGGEIISASECALTYYSKELKIAFEFDDKIGYIIAKCKQKNDAIFIDGNLTIDNNSVNIKLNFLN